MHQASRADTGFPTSDLEVGKPHLTFTHFRRARGAPSEDLIWLRERLDEHWLAAYRLIPDEGRFAVGELRVIPYDEQAAAGALPAAKTRELALERAVYDARDIAEWFEDNPASDREYVRRIFERFGVSSATDARASRARTPDAELARVAAVWVETRRGGSKAPTRDTAHALGFSHSAVAKKLHKARARGLLTGGGRGRIDGELTPRGGRALSPDST